MQSLLPVIGLAVLAAILAVFLKESKMPVLGVLLTLVAGALIFIMLLPRLGQVLGMFVDLADKTQINTYYLATLFKIIGVAYIAEFAAQLCRDAGQGALAFKVELAAKIGILLLAMPIMAAILQSILRFLS
ncbi:MAG: stage III sporulation protein AD [Bacillota bacterium]|jgi:stage III sporulation protein AD